MTSTPPPDLERELRSAMAPGPVDLRPDPDFTRATVARATRERPRRRVAYAVGLPLAAAAVTAGVVVVIEREGVGGPSGIEAPDICCQCALQGICSRIAADPQLAQMRDVENPRRRSHRVVLRNHPRVLKRHLPASELGQLCVELAMLLEEW